MKQLLTITVVLILISCSSNQGSKVDIRDNIDIPDKWSSETVAQNNIEKGWWKQFNDPQLDKIIEEALENNRDLKVAALNIDTAMARFNAAKSQYYPKASLSGSASRERQVLIGLDIPGVPDILKTESDRKSLEFGVSWEVDIWGKFRYEAGSAKSLLSSEKYEYEYARLSLISEICRSYLEIIALKTDQSILKNIIEIETEILSIISRRFDSGLTEASAIHRQHQSISILQAELGALEKLTSGIIRGLEVMIGRYPAGELDFSNALPVIKAPIPAGLPADIIGRRPDVMAAEQRLIASGYELAASKTDLYPKIALTASGGTVSERFRDILNGNFSVWSLLGSVTQPLFEGGRIRSRIRVSESLSNQYLELYLNKVMNSFYEVESGINSDISLKEQIDLHTDALAELNTLHEDRSERFSRGLEDAPGLLEIRKELKRAERRIITARKNYLINRINLYLALGGGFNGKL